MNMDFGANKTSVEIFEEDAFTGTYFRDIHSGGNIKWYRKSWKEFDELKLLLLVLINIMSNVEHH